MTWSMSISSMGHLSDNLSKRMLHCHQCICKCCKAQPPLHSEAISVWMKNTPNPPAHSIGIHSKALPMGSLLLKPLQIQLGTWAMAKSLLLVPKNILVDRTKSIFHKSTLLEFLSVTSGPGHFDVEISL